MHEPEPEMESAGYPQAFRSYLLYRYPLGEPWRPPAPRPGSNLSGLYYQLHEKRRDGGVPPLRKDFMRDLDIGVEPIALRAAGLSFTAEQVAVVVAQLATSKNTDTRRKMEVLRFFQDREMEAEFGDWCKAENLDERTAYRWCNEAVELVWKWLKRRHQGPNVGNLTQG